MTFIGMMELYHEDRMMINRLIGHYNYQNTQVKELTDEIEKLSQTDRYRERCAYLRAFRGIQILIDMTILTYIPYFRDFPHP